MDGMAATWTRDTPWRQGHLLTAEAIEALGLSHPETGKCGLVDTVPQGCFYPDLLIRLQFDDDVMRPQFAALQWNAPSTHKRLISRAKSTNGIWNINGSDIRQHTLKVPSIEMQDALLEEIRSIRQARADIEKRKTLAQNLKVLALKEIA